jgi:hypothetical protein
MDVPTERWLTLLLFRRCYFRRCHLRHRTVVDTLGHDWITGNQDRQFGHSLLAARSIAGWIPRTRRATGISLSGGTNPESANASKAACSSASKSKGSPDGLSSTPTTQSLHAVPLATQRPQSTCSTSILVPSASDHEKDRESDPLVVRSRRALTLLDAEPISRRLFASESCRTERSCGEAEPSRVQLAVRSPVHHQVS